MTYTRIGVMRALNRNVERTFDSTRKHSLGKPEAEERRMTCAGACSMLDGFVLFDENCAYVRFFAAIAPARHSCFASRLSNTILEQVLRQGTAPKNSNW
jgi:hypothetical protein